MSITNTNSRIILQAAKKLGITARVLDSAKLKIKLTYGAHSHLVHSHSFGLNPHQAILLTRNKLKTLDLLRRHGLPVPSPRTPGFPLALKPVSGQKGQHVYLDIRNQAQLDAALKQISGPTLMQQFIPGKDLRFFVLNNQVIGIVHRQPPTLIGDGHSTIKEVLDQENRRRVKLTQTSGRRLLNRLRHWPRIKWYLKLQGLSLESVLPEDKTIELYPLANFSTGGSAHALTSNQVHSSLISLAQKAVTLTGLTVVGVDMIVKDWHKPTSAKGRSSSGRNAYILEVNSDPSLRLHAWPNTGRPQPVAEKLLQYIFSLKSLN